MSFRVKLGEITFPVAPTKITVVQKCRNRTVDLIDGSQTVIAKKPSLREYRMELILPRRLYPFAFYESEFLPPEHFLDAVNSYAYSGKAVSLVVERGVSYESCPVFVGDATCVENAADGEDVTLSLTLLASDEENVYPKVPKTYFARTDDTLRLIARKVWGDETRWTELYRANRDQIEHAARKAGFADSRLGERLIPNLELVIPQEVDSYGKRS